MSYHLFSHVHAITTVRHEQRKTWKFVLQEKEKTLPIECCVEILEGLN